MNQFKKFLNRDRNEDPFDAQEIILSDEYLFHVYQKVLIRQLSAIKSIEETKIIELGSSGGISKKLWPNITTLDIREGPDVDVVIDPKNQLPFENETINLVLAKDVLHHINDVQGHFEEMNRILLPGGKVVYTEPNWNVLSKVIFKWFHPEPYSNSQSEWNFESTDPMFSNQALAWIIFIRDSHLFNVKNPNFEVNIESVPLNGLSFLLSGGVYRRTKISSRLLVKIDEIESRVPSWLRIVGLSRNIVITKTRS